MYLTCSHALAFVYNLFSLKFASAAAEVEIPLGIDSTIRQAVVLTSSVLSEPDYWKIFKNCCAML